MRTLLFGILLTITAALTCAQPYGNEWIKPNQSYYKIPVSKDACYRISYAQLVAAGLPVVDIDPRNLQLFNNGQEVAIYVHGEADGSLDAGDAIEFWGYQNSGKMDKPLYRNPGEHTNPYVSLYADTAYYYLTWSNTPSTYHLSDYQNTDFSNKTADDFFIHEVVMGKGSAFNAGLPINNDAKRRLSEYTRGEGYHYTRNTRKQEFKLNTPAPYPNGSFACQISAYSDNNPTISYNGYNHSLGVAINNINNTLVERPSNGYNHLYIDSSQLKISSSQLTATTSVFVGEEDYVNRPESYHSVAFIRAWYPRAFDLTNTSTLEFTPSSKTYFRFTNYAPGKNTPIVWDIDNRSRIQATLTADSIQFNLKNSSSRIKLIDSTDILPVTTIKPVQFESHIASGINYLIISHPSLKQGAEAYANYRSSTQGGGFQVKILYSTELYESFYYGINHHPLAVRNAIAYYQDVLKEDLEYVLLLGKGQEYNEIRFNDSKREAWDLVPAIGTPPSDYLFVSPLNASSLNISVPIGRVPVRSNTDVSVYLDKVMEHENASGQAWKKHLVHVVGGKDIHQNREYLGYVNQYYAIAQDTFLGAHRSLFSKNEATTVSDEFVEQIQAAIDTGASIFTYFGHGSAQILEVEIGDPVDLNNQGKYPLFIFNGCALGNAYVESSLGEDFMLVPNRGAINWIAGSGFGYTTPLLDYTKKLYEELCVNQYGESVGNAIKRTIERYQNPTHDLNIINSRQLIYLGDPALPLQISKLPDVHVSSAAISNQFNSAGDVVMAVNLENLGITSRDSVELVLKATNGAQEIELVRANYAIPLSSDDLELRFEKNNALAGQVTFTITLDPTNAISEQMPNGESNNVYQFQHIFELNKPLIISPLPNAIISSTNTTLLMQVSNPQKRLMQVEIQGDTSPYFTNKLIQYRLDNSLSLIEQNINIPLQKAQDFFIRCRTILDGDTSEWSNAPFAYRPGEYPGWSEEHEFNKRNATYSKLLHDTLTDGFEFTRTVAGGYSIMTNGRYPSSGFDWNLIRISEEISIIRNYKPNGVSFCAINPDNQKRWIVNSQYNQRYPSNPYWAANPVSHQAEYYATGALTGIYQLDTRQASARDTLVELLKAIPDGYHLLMHNNKEMGIDNWEQEIYDELKKFGVVDLEQVNEGEPFAIFGTKGKPERLEIQYGNYSDTINPPINQTFEMFFNLSPLAEEGNVLTERIGPSTKWYDASIKLKNFDVNTDAFSINILGIDTANYSELLIEDSKDTLLDLSSIDARKYPYLQLQLILKDAKNLTPVHLQSWTVHYDGAAEVLMDIDSINYLSSELVKQGQELIYSTVLRNVTDQSFDSSVLETSLIDGKGNQQTLSLEKLDSLTPKGYLILRDTIATDNLQGEYQLLVNANSDRAVIEGTYTNNVFARRFVVEVDQRDPVLDVTFDGSHILNNDIVSPNTLITITGSDENPYFLLDDPMLFDVGLRKPGSDSFTPIDAMDPAFSFQAATKANEAATILYQTQDLPDGQYTLRAKLVDPSGNGADNEYYEVNFKVISEQQLSHVFAYPNPFTTCTKFLFTLTGSEIPDRIRINIYTITGRLVRQIDETELGVLKIGTNLTDYCWDGTDEFGDKLANGVYLYRVEASMFNQDIKHFETDKDNLFVNGMGKLYIAR